MGGSARKSQFSHAAEKYKFVFQVEIKIANTKTLKTMLTGYAASVFSGYKGGNYM